MKVLLINGSARVKGNTALALDAAAEVFQAQGLATEKIEVGGELVHGCVGCFGCVKKRNRQCVRFPDDPVNGWIEKMVGADGFFIGTPVYYAGLNGTLKAFLDRAFFAATAGGFPFRHKVGAAMAAVRRAGSLPAVEQINKYFTISEMFVSSSNYWNMVYGMEPGEAARDEEGLQCVRVLAANMAWLLKLMEHGRAAVPPPPLDKKVFTNFIR